jgi:hypothetical protein
VLKRIISNFEELKMSKNNLPKLLVTRLEDDIPGPAIKMLKDRFDLFSL